MSEINLFEHMPCLVWIVDTENRIIYFNQKTLLLIKNAALSGIIGQELTSAFTIFQNPLLNDKIILREIDRDSSVVEIELNVKGEQTWWEFIFTDFKSGKLIIAKDVSEKTKSQKAYRNLNESLKTILNNAPNSILLFNPEGIVLELNNPTEKLLGYNKYELIGKNIFTSKPSFVVQDLVTKVLQKKSKYLIPTGPEEVSLRNKNGEIVSVQITLIPIKLNNQDVILASANNVTILKKYEKLLSEISDRFKLLADTIPIGTVVKDNKQLFFNQVFIYLTGYTNEDISTVDEWFSKLYGERCEQEFQKYEEARLNHFKDPFETCILSKASEKIFLEFIVYEYESVEIWLAYNITDRVKTSQILIENEEKFKLLFENAPFGFILHDETRILDYNKRFCNLLGYSEEEVIDKSLSNFESRQTAKAKSISDLIKDSLNGQNFSKELELLKKDGSIVIADVTFIHINLNNSRRCQIVVDDLSARKRIEKTQKAIYKISEAAHSSENLPELYLKIHQIIQELMSADNFYIALYNSDDDSLTIPYFVDEVDTAEVNETIKMGRGLTEYIIRTEQNLIVETELNRKLQLSGEVDLVGEDSKIWIGVLLKSKGKIIGAMVVQDYKNENAYTEKDKEILVFVSEQVASAIERKTTEEKLKRYNEELEESKKLIENKATELSILNNNLKTSEKQLLEMNASKDKFFSIVAHDLKSPFMGLLGLSEVLLQEIDNITPDETKHYLTQIRNSTKNVFNLVENLLQWSRIQTGRIPLEQIPLNLLVEVGKIKSLLELNAQNKGIEIINSVSSEIKVNADANMLSSVLQNLISNAIKFTSSGGKITISSISKGDFEEIHVKDTGVGLKQDAKDYLFKIDKQYTTIGTSKEKGTGLGLLLCKELINLNKGEIGVNSIEGRGSDFFFTLPKIS